MRPATSPGHTAIDQFLKGLQEATHKLESAGIDTGRLLTVFDVSLQSIKKIERSDIIVGVGAASGADPVIVTRRVDPNVSHPYRRKDILERLAQSGSTIGSYEFDAAVRHFKLRYDPAYCWRDGTTDLTKWSPETTAYLRRERGGEPSGSPAGPASWLTASFSACQRACASALSSSGAACCLLPTATPHSRRRTAQRPPPPPSSASERAASISGPSSRSVWRRTSSNRGTSPR